MGRKGTIKSWDDQRGFGFISPDDNGGQVFLHISAFSRRNRRPVVGDTLSFTMSRDEAGRPRAINVRFSGDRRLQIFPWGSKSVRGRASAIFFACVFFGLLSTWVHFGKIPVLVLWAYLALSSITFLMYFFDKNAARKGSWRTSEATLHWLAIIGGWPGALLGQQLLRHKSNKKSFRIVFWVSVVLNCAALAWVFTSPDGGTVRVWIDQFQQQFNVNGSATIEWAK